MQLVDLNGTQKGWNCLPIGVYCTSSFDLSSSKNKGLELGFTNLVNSIYLW